MKLLIIRKSCGDNRLLAYLIMIYDWSWQIVWLSIFLINSISFIPSNEEVGLWGSLTLFGISLGSYLRDFLNTKFLHIYNESFNEAMPSDSQMNNFALRDCIACWCLRDWNQLWMLVVELEPQSRLLWNIGVVLFLFIFTTNFGVVLEAIFPA